jgi:hypothetical protein
MVSQGPTKKTVTLTFNHNITGPVYVAGTFNNWDTSATPMKKTRTGAWEAKLKLSPGEHEFRYFSNGQWFTDYAADGIVPNGYGDFNSVVRVSDDQPAAAAKPAAVSSPTGISAAAKPMSSQPRPFNSGRR